MGHSFMETCLASASSESVVGESTKVAAMKRVKCVFTDIDGTLLGSDHKLAAVTVDAIKDVMVSLAPLTPCQT